MESDRGNFAGTGYCLVLFFLQFYVWRVRGHGQFSEHLLPRPVWAVKSARWGFHDHRCPRGKFPAARGRVALGQDRRLPLAFAAVGWCGGVSWGGGGGSRAFSLGRGLFFVSV